MRAFQGLQLLLAASATLALHRDLLLQAVCADRCGKDRECREKCYKEPLEKAGECGANNSDPFLSSCLAECSVDKDCTWLDKCCQHDCGRTCQPPVGLDTLPGLPAVPENVTLLQLSDMRNVLVDWEHAGGCQFVIELREEAGPWFPAHKAPRVTHPLRIPVRPGVEYSARVAAVSSRGSRGFSAPSNTIILHLEMKPPDAPSGLSFKGSMKNGSVSGLLSWEPAMTDQFISKYTVQWSQRFFVEEARPDKGSIEVHRKSVPHGKHCLRIKNLYPNVTYTFHVQAQIFYGQEKIPSKKATLMVDTSKFSSISKRGIKQRPKHFSVYYKFLPIPGGFNVKISWPVKEKAKYAISWETECDTKSISIVITGSNYVIPDVKKNCSYQVVIREKSDCKKRRKLGKLTFKVP